MSSKCSYKSQTPILFARLRRDLVLYFSRAFGNTIGKLETPIRKLESTMSHFSQTYLWEARNTPNVTKTVTQNTSFLLKIPLGSSKHPFENWIRHEIVTFLTKYLWEARNTPSKTESDMTLSHFSQNTFGKLETPLRKLSQTWHCHISHKIPLGSSKHPFENWIRHDIVTFLNKIPLGSSKHPFEKWNPKIWYFGFPFS